MSEPEEFFRSEINLPELELDADGDFSDIVPEATPEELVPGAFQPESPEDLARIVVNAAADIKSDFDSVVTGFLQGVNSSLAIAGAIQAGMKANCVQGVFRWLLPAEDFLQNWRMIIEGVGSEVGLTPCEQIVAVMEYARTAIQVNIKENIFLPDEAQAIQNILDTYEALSAQCLGGGERINAFYDHAQQAIVGSCEDEPQQPIVVPEPSPPIQIPQEGKCMEICGMDKLLELIECLCKPKAMEQKPIIAWLNCTTGSSTLLPEGQEPEGEGWQESPEIQELVDNVVNEACGLLEDPDTPDDGSLTNQELEDLLKGIVGADIKCDLPGYWQLDVNLLNSIANMITAAAGAGALAGIVNVLPLPIKKMPEGTAGFYLLAGMTVFALKQVTLIGSARECPSDLLKHALVARVIYTFLERIVPGTHQEQIQATTQIINLECPKLVPTVNDANFSFLADAIDFDQWRCIVRANGFDEKFMAEVVEAQRSKLTTNELVTLFNRDQLTPEEYTKRIRELGFLKNKDPAEIHSLSEQRPGMADIIHMMVRDVEDQAIVNRFNLMADFGTKFKGNLERWAKDQNIPTQYIKHMWAAHWRYPGYRQLTEALHRFRHLPPGHKLRTTLADVEIALKADDLPEFWVDRMIAMSFQPLGRIDVRRAFRMGAINEQDLPTHFQALGFDDAAVQTQVRFAVLEKKRSWLKHTAVKQYAAGHMSFGELREWLMQEGADNNDVQEVMRRADLISSVTARKRCLAALRKRFLDGEVNSTEIEKDIIGLGVAVEQAVHIADQWTCELRARGKNASLSQLCQWLENGTINIVEYKRRLLNLGWSNSDADRIIKVCEERILLKVTAQERKRLNEMEKEAEKRLREAEKKRKEQERLEKARKGQIDKAQKLRIKIDKKLIEASKRKSEAFDMEESELFSSLKQLHNSLSALGGNHPDAVIALIEHVSKDGEIATLDEFRNSVVDMLTPEESFGGL